MSRTFGNNVVVPSLPSPLAGSTVYTSSVTNENFQGVYIYVPVSVTGWSSSDDDLQLEFQWSPDGGTTWVSGQTGSGILGVGQNFSHAGGAIAATVEGPLPRTWRIGFNQQSGSSAVYALSNAYLEYFN